MFKRGQVWRSFSNKSRYLITEVGVSYVRVRIISGRHDGVVGKVSKGAVLRECEHIGNNYQERKTPRETHNLIQNLRCDNKELRRENKDLRDDIGDMASKLHLAHKRTLEVMTPHAKEFPGAAFKRWLSDMTGDLPEQRGCRKEDC